MAVAATTDLLRVIRPDGRQPPTLTLMNRQKTTPIARVLIGIAIGCVSGALGLAPWLITGATLPLQNLWATSALSDEMPVSLLPISQYFATRILALLVVGGAIAGLTVRLVRPSLGVPSWAAATGLLLVHGIAILQSFTVVADGLGISQGGTDMRALLYFGGMLGGTLATAVLAQASFWLVSRRAVGAAALGLSLSAVPAASWVVDGIAMVSGPAGLPADVLAIARWLPAILAGIVLGWCGIRPPRRLAVWIVALASLWITPAVITALTYALGMRVLDGDVAAMGEAATQIFPVALGIGGLPVLLAVVLGGLIVGGRELIRLPARSSKNVPGEPEMTP